MGVKTIILPNGKTFIKSNDLNHTFSGVYTDAELIEFISSLDHCVDANSNDFALCFRANDRSATLYYDVQQKQWQFIYDGKMTASDKSCETKTLINAMKDKFYNPNTNAAVFATEVYHPKQNLLSVTKDIGKWQEKSEWQNMHEVTASKTNLLGYANTSWLRIAASFDLSMTVKRLLSAGANTNQADDDQTTPLHIAIKKKHFDIAKLILERKADPNIPEPDGMTPLHTATSLGDDDAVELLLKHGANPNLVDKYGIAPLHYAIARNKIIVIDQLSAVTDPNLKLPSIFPSQEWLIYRARGLGYRSDENGICFGVSHMGMQAILAEETEIFDQRLRALFTTSIKKFTPQTSSKELPEGTLPFFDGVELYAQGYAYPEYFENEKRLITQSALAVAPLIIPEKLEKQYKDTPANKGKIVELDQLSSVNIYTHGDLEKLFASLAENLKSTDAPTSLILSSSAHSISIGFNPKKMPHWQFIDTNSLPTQYIDNYKQLALKVHQAITFSQDKSIPAMFATNIYALEKNAAIIQKQLETWQANDEWKKMHTITADKIAFKEPYDHTSLLMLAIKKENLKKVVELLALGASPNLINREGETPLHYAASRNNVEIVKVLIQHHADINATNNKNLSAIFYAAQNGQIEIVKLLIQNKANLNVTDKHGHSLIHLAARHGHIETVKVLLQHKLDLNQANKNNETAIHIAAKFGQIDMVKYLLTEKPTMKHVENARDMLEAELKNQTQLAPDMQVTYRNIIKILTLRIELEKMFPEENADFGYKFKSFFQTAKSAEAAKALKNVLYQHADKSMLKQHQEVLHNKSFEENIYKPCSEVYRELLSDAPAPVANMIKSSGAT